MTEPLAVPVIRLEVEYMKHAILHAFSAHQVALDQLVKDAVERYCSDENLRKLIDEAVRAAIESSIREGTKGFFGWGEGKKAIDGAVKAGLRAWLDSKESP